MPEYLSPLATHVSHRTTAINRRKPWGLLIHTTGRGIVEKAAKKGTTPIDVARKWYKLSQDGANGYPWGGPGYLMGHEGDIYQLAPDDVITNHAGGPDRDEYLSGAWVKLAPAAAVHHWRAQWPGFKSPQHLYPSKSANTDYIGVEVIPCGSGFGVPMRPGLLFTEAQHTALGALARDVGSRHCFPAGWARTPRLLGHEDVQILERGNSGGGWDPGWLRGQPYFDFEHVRALV